MAKSSWKVPAFVVAAMGAGTLLGRLLGYKFGPNLVVRCRRGHLYTTIWIPGIKLKGLDLGLARFQCCPVGRHWSLTVPVKESTLSEEERAAARSHRDLKLP